MRIYGEVVPSRVDGPGLRAVLHTAGCSIGCPGCFNPHTHAAEGRLVRSLTHEALVREVLRVSPHLTVSGGEPTDQLEDLLDFLRLARRSGVESVILYSGRTRSWLQKRPLWCKIEEEGLVDTLIDGPFDLRQPETVRMAGSANQQFHHLTNRFSEFEFADRGVEIQIAPDGSVTFLGFPSPKFLNMFSTGEATCNK